MAAKDVRGWVPWGRINRFDGGGGMRNGGKGLTLMLLCDHFTCRAVLTPGAAPLPLPPSLPPPLPPKEWRRCIGKDGNVSCCLLWLISWRERRVVIRAFELIWMSGRKTLQLAPRARRAAPRIARTIVVRLGGANTAARTSTVFLPRSRNAKNIARKRAPGAWK